MEVYDGDDVLRIETSHVQLVFVQSATHGSWDDLLSITVRYALAPAVSTRMW